MSSKSKKIIGGSLALLFIVSIVQTQAILKITDFMSVASLSSLVPSDSQSAQVSGNLSLSGADKSCVQFSSIEDNPNYLYDVNFNDSVVDLSYLQYSDAVKNFIIVANIKNTCNYDIAIVDDSGVPITIGNQDISPVRLENFYDREQDLGITFQRDYIQKAWDLDWETDINDIPVFGVMTQVDTPGLTPDTISAWTIPAGQSENFAFISYISKYNENLPSDMSTDSRLSLRQLRWFRVSNANDNLLTVSEVKTAYVPDSERRLLNTSFVKFVNTNLYNDDGSGVEQQEFIQGVMEVVEKSIEELRTDTKKIFETHQGGRAKQEAGVIVR